MAEEIYLSRGKRYAIDVIGQAPRAITAEDFEASALVIMQTEVDELSAELATKSAELAALKSSADAFRAHATQSTHAARDAIANTTLDDAATVAAIAQIVESVLTPERDRKLAAALDSRAKLDAQIAALGG